MPNFPSVTTIIKAAGLMPDYSRMDTYARDRGAAVHKAIELHHRGTLDETTVDRSVRPYLDAFKQWQVFTKAEPVDNGTAPLVEYEIRDELLGYIGHIDLVCTIAGCAWVIDYKAGDVDPWHAIQTAAYWKLYRLAPKRGTLYLTPDVKPPYKLREHKDSTDWLDFQAALRLMQRRTQWNRLS
jgi:hypothetical protein